MMTSILYLRITSIRSVGLCFSYLTTVRSCLRAGRVVPNDKHSQTCSKILGRRKWSLEADGEFRSNLVQTQLSHGTCGDVLYNGDLPCEINSAPTRGCLLRSLNELQWLNENVVFGYIPYVYPVLVLTEYMVNATNDLVKVRCFIKHRPDA